MPEQEREIDLYGLLCACFHHVKAILAVALAVGLALGLLQFVRLSKKDASGNSAITSYAEKLSAYQDEMAYYNNQLANVEEKIRNEYQSWNSSFFDSLDSVYQTTRIFTVLRTSDVSALQDDAVSFVSLWNDSDLFYEMELNRDAYFTALMTDRSGNILHNKLDLFVSLSADHDGALILTALGESPEKAEELADKAEALLVFKWNDRTSPSQQGGLEKIGTSSQKVYDNPHSENTDLYEILIKRRDEIIGKRAAVSSPSSPKSAIVLWAFCGFLVGLLGSAVWTCVASYRRQTLEHRFSAEKVCGISLIGNEKTDNVYLAEKIRILSDKYGKILVLSDVPVGEKALVGLCTEKTRFFDNFFRNKDALAALESSDAVVLLGKTGVSSAVGFDHIRSFAQNLNKPILGYIMK